MSPQTSQSGWTVPVPNQFSIGQSGQVYFHYGPPFSGMQQTVPVQGINPFTTFNGLNGMPHWSTLTTGFNAIDRFYSSPDNYSSVFTPAPFGSPWQSPQTPILVASVYNPTTGIQVGATNINGFTTTLNNFTLNNFGATFLTYRNLNSTPYTSSNSFTTSTFSSSYSSNYYSTYYSSQRNQSLILAQRMVESNNSLANSFFRASNDPKNQFRSLAGAGDKLASEGRYKDAIAAYERALPVSQSAGDKLGQAVVHSCIGQTYLSMGEGQRALDHFNQAYLASQEMHGLKMQIFSLRGKGAAYMAEGDSELALDSYRRARSLVSFMNDEATDAEIIASMGWVYQWLGEPQQALVQYQAALDLIVKTGNRTAEVKTRVGIGLLYHYLGEPEKALEQYRKAIVIAKSQVVHYSPVIPGSEEREKALAIAKGSTEMAGILTSAGEAYQSLGMKLKALDSYEHALPLWRKTGNKVGEAGTLASMARTYLSLGWLQTAFDNYNQALQLMRAEGNRAGEAGVLAGIGEVYFWDALKGYELRAEGIKYGANRSDTFPKALRHYEAALALMKAMRNHAGEVGILMNIGLVYDSWEKPEKALEYYHEAIAGLESMRTSARLEEFRTSLAQQSVAVYERAILLHVRLGQREQAFDLSERARSRTFLDQLGNARIDVHKGMSAPVISQEQALSRELGAFEKQLQQELAKPVSLLNQEVIQSLETRLTTSRAEYEDLLTHLKLSNPEYASLLSVDTLSLAQAQQLLDPDVTLVSYFVTTDKTLAFVITRESFHVAELDVHQSQLEAATNNFRDFASLNGAPSPDLKQLYKWLITPLKSHLKTPLLGIVPHGILHNLPFAAFTDGKRFLGDRHTLFCLPSVSALRFIQKKRVPGDERLLALAYGQGDGIPSLRYAEEEARAVAGLYGTQPRAGNGATKSSFLASAAEYNILHLVAHYEPNAINPLFSRLRLAPGEDSDGSLTLQDVYSLDLKRTSLVVLSACQSQLGAHSRGDDIVGLGRAFMYAGTSTVVASLWSVDDQATTMLMTAFYTHLKKGLGPAAALRAAQTEMRSRYPHPYYWAGFVLTGYPGTATASQPASDD